MRQDASRPRPPSRPSPILRERFVGPGAAHGKHEERNGGQYDENWSDWYAEYIVREQSGEELPQ